MDALLFYYSNAVENAFLYCILLVSLTVYYRIHNRYDFYYIVTSIFAQTTEISITRTINAAFFYFYFIVLLLLLFVTLCVVNICYTMTDNIVITVSSAVCSFVFMIVFYLITSEDLHIISLLVKISSFFIAEMVIIAAIVLTQNI